MTGTDTATAIEVVYRIESARIIAGVARIVRDVGIAEELAQDALVAALEKWPESGVPDKPGAWLMATAKHRAVDLIRRKETYARKLAEVGRAISDVPPPEPPDAEDIDDDLLRLIFTSCHPVLSTQARIALTLRLLGGLTTEEIARAFLASESTIAQRIVRAKRNLAKAGVPFEVPYGDERDQRLSSVLEVIYLIFNEGYSATSGDDLVRPVLCEDALRMARVLAGLMPAEPEAHGLAALLEFQGSRLKTRTTRDGAPVLLADQDRSKWDRLLVRRGVESLRYAGTGPHSLQAAIAACHARANRYEDTDWPLIATLYGRLLAVTPSPVVALNRAVAVSMADGPSAGLELVDALTDSPGMREYHLLPSVRGDLLERLGRLAEARAEFGKAAALTRNERERTLLRQRAANTLGARHMDQELVDAALAQLDRRWPGGAEGGAAAVRTATGETYTSVALDNLNAAATLCHETGAIIQAFTHDRAVTASVCVARLAPDATPVVLPPCGICRERLALWGPDVEVAVADPTDPTKWIARKLSEVHIDYWGRQFPEESGWPPA